MKRTLAILATLSAFALALPYGAALAADPPAKDALSGATLWSYLQEAKYSEWEMWPGKEAFYPGTEPHGMLLTTYLNGPALQAATKKTGMPAGAIVVKENYKPDKVLAAVTVMYKVEGYNPEAGDWFWGKYKADGAVEKEGPVGGCIKCHGSKADNDYIFLGPVK